MGSRGRRMWRRNRRRYVHYEGERGHWFDEECTYTVCDTQIGNGIRTSEDTGEITCPRCIKWLADQVERVLAAEVVDAMLDTGTLTRSLWPSHRPSWPSY